MAIQNPVTISTVDSSGDSVAVVGSNGAVPVSLDTLLAGERNVGESNQYFASVPECNGTPVDVSTNSTDVSTVPALLFGIYIICIGGLILNFEAVGLHDGTGGTELITIPIGTAGELGIAGTHVVFPGIKFNDAIFVESTNATGNITVSWRPQ